MIEEKTHRKAANVFESISRTHSIHYAVFGCVCVCGCGAEKRQMKQS